MLKQKRRDARGRGWGEKCVMGDQTDTVYDVYILGRNDILIKREYKALDGMCWYLLIFVLYGSQGSMIVK